MAGIPFYYYLNDGTDTNRSFSSTNFTDGNGNPVYPTVEQVGFSRNGYVFVEWNLSSDGSGTGFTAGTQIADPGAGYTLYAIWEEDIVTYLTTNTELTSIANAIRTKGGTSEQLTFPDGFVTAIGNIETGITPTGTINITANGTVDVTNYANANVNVPTGITPTGTISITANGTVDVTNYASADVNVPSQKRPNIDDPVRFFDYNGSILYSYTVAEANALTELPDVPTHDGLTSQGWNWTLANIKTLIADTGACDVGAIYTTTDGSTRLYVSFNGNRKSPCLGLCPNGTVSVDWGDGSSAETMTGTSLTTQKYLTHTYSSNGDYVISLSAVSGTFAIRGSGSYSHLLKLSSTSTANANAVYLASLKRVELGSSVSISNYAFYGCVNLESITIPNSVTALNEGAFWNNYNLNHLNVSTSVTALGNNLFRSCYRLDSISIPKQLTSFGTGLSYDTHSINRIVVPSGVTAISGNCFYNDVDLAEVYLSNSLTSIGAGGFQSCRSLRKVKMPTGITSLGSYAFTGCVCLQEMSIPTGIGTIDSSTFSGCSGLAEITIPSNISVINANAFANCYGLSEIHFKSSTPPTVSATSAFSNLPTDCTIYVPSGSLSAYMSATNYPSSSTYTYVGE